MRIGIDVGGTKIEGMALAPDGGEMWRRRVSTPQGDYEGTVRAIAGLVEAAERELGARGSVGLAIPGTISTSTGLVKNANSVCLIGKPLDRDLETRLDRPLRIANDANCFALSEAADGAAEGARTVFGVIFGTGVGGGVCVDGRVIAGAHGIAGEWGHNPLPAPRHDEIDGPDCYCGRRGCIETWLSGPALTRQYSARLGRAGTTAELATAHATGEPVARAVMEAWLDRSARALGTVVNLLDPDAIVLGGGLSNIALLFEELPHRVQAYAFAAEGPVRVVRNRHGDSSGVRGAAWLWSEQEWAEATSR